MVGVESVLLHSPNKGFWVCPGDSPPGMPRRSKVAPLSSGQIVPRVTTDQQLRVTPFIPHVRHNVKHSIDGCFGQPQCLHCSDTALTVPALIRELHWHRCWTDEPGYATGNQSMEHRWHENTLYLFTPTPMPSLIFYLHIVLFLL